MTMNMVGVQSRQQGEGRIVGEGGVEKVEPESESNDDLSNLVEGSTSDEGGATPGSSVNGTQSQPTTRSDNRKSKLFFIKAVLYPQCFK